jgi:hypothetical protein
MWPIAAAEKGVLVFLRGFAPERHGRLPLAKSHEQILGGLGVGIWRWTRFLDAAAHKQRLQPCDLGAEHGDPMFLERIESRIASSLASSTSRSVTSPSSLRTSMG